MIDKFLRYSYYTLFFAAPLIMYPYTSEIFEFNKIIFIYLFTSIIVFIWILKMICAKKLILRRTVLDIPVTLLFISFTLSTIFSLDPHTSVWGYYGRFNGGLASIASYIILYYALASNFTADFIYRILKVSLISSLIVILWGLPGKFGYDLSCFAFTGDLSNSCWTDQFRPAERMFSTLGQPNWLGAYLAIHFFIGLFFLLQKNATYFLRLTYGSYIVLNFTAILFTRSRSALLAVVSGGIIFIFYILINWNYGKRVWQIGSILAACLLFSILLFKSGIPTIDKYISFEKYFSRSGTQEAKSQNNSTAVPLIERYDVTESFDIRKIVWDGAIEIGRRYPLLGSGLETFAYSYYMVRPRSHNLTSEWDYLYNKAHNEYLNYFATTGYTGIAVYMIFIAAVLFLFVKQIFNKNIDEDSRLLNICLLLSYITILITNFFGFSTTTISIFFYTIPALFFLQHTQKSDKLHYSVNTLKQRIGIGLSLSLLLFISTFIYIYWNADFNYKKGDDAYRAGDYQTSAYHLNEALKLRNEHVYEDKLSYVSANLSVLLASEGNKESTANFMKVADIYNLKTLQSSPRNVLYWKTRAKNLYFFYQISPDEKYIKEGLNALKKASELSPTDPKIPYTEAIFYSLSYDAGENKDEYKFKSLKAIDYSIELKENYRDAYFLKGQLLNKFGDKEQAKEVYEYILSQFNPHDVEVKKELENL